MRRVAVVEFRGQRSVHELSFDEGADIVIGRGWDSDVVVGDEFVDGAHLRLRRDESGKLLVEDLGTRNGTRIDRRPLKRPTPCADGTRLFLGETTITLHEATADVAPATRFDAVNVLARRFDSVLWIVPASVFAVIALLGDIHLLGAEETRGDAVLEVLSGIGVMALAWCLVGGIIGKVLRHRAHVGLHWIVVCLIVTGAVVLNLAAGLLAFNLDSAALDGVMSPVLNAVLVFASCYAFLSLSTRLRRSWRAAAGLLAGALPIVFSVVLPALQEDHERWSAVAVAGSVRQPAGMLLVAPTTVADHFERTERLFEAFEDVAREPRAPRDGTPGGDGEDGRILSSDAG